MQSPERGLGRQEWGVMCLAQQCATPPRHVPAPAGTTECSDPAWGRFFCEHAEHRRSTFIGTVIFS